MLKLLKEPPKQFGKIFPNCFLTKAAGQRTLRSNAELLIKSY